MSAAICMWLDSHPPFIFHTHFLTVFILLISQVKTLPKLKKEN